MMRVARPTTISDRTVTRLILIVAAILAIGIMAFALFYWSDRHVQGGASMADQAVAAAEAAVQANPNDVAARDRLAAAYQAAKRPEDAITQFGEALKISATDRAALLGRGIVYLSTGQLDPAAADFQAFIDNNATGEFAKSDPQLEQAYYELGVVQLKQGKAATAVDTLQKALAINASDADALYSLGQALNMTGDPKGAIQVLRMAAAYVPTGWPEPYQELVTAYTALGEPDGTAWANGMVAMCEGDPAAAKAALEPLAGGPMKIDALMGLGYVAAQGGDNATAASYFNQVLALDPSNASAVIALGSISHTSSAAPSPLASPSAQGSN